MRHAMKRIWQATRDHFTRWVGAGRTRSAAAVAEPAPIVEAQVPIAEARAPIAEARAPPGMPSIAVRSFTGASGHGGRNYFAEGIAGDIATQLSRSTALFVAARESSFAYRGPGINVKQIGRDLGVRHVLEGSVQRTGEQVRINATLIDAESGKPVWAKRFERTITDLFELQDAIADASALAIAPDISPAERERIVCKPIVSHRVVVGATASGQGTGSAHSA
jgi:TolB-like protein